MKKKFEYKVYHRKLEGDGKKLKTVLKHTITGDVEFLNKGLAITNMMKNGNLWIAGNKKEQHEVDNMIKLITKQIENNAIILI